MISCQCDGDTCKQEKTLKINITLNDIIVKRCRADVVRYIHTSTKFWVQLKRLPPAPPPAPPSCTIMFRCKRLYYDTERQTAGSWSPWESCSICFLKRLHKLYIRLFCLKHWPTAVVQLPATIFPPKGHTIKTTSDVYLHCSFRRWLLSCIVA